MKLWEDTYRRLPTDKYLIVEDCTATLAVSLESVLVSTWYTLVLCDTDKSPLSGFFLPRPTARMCLRLTRVFCVGCQAAAVC